MHHAGVNRFVVVARLIWAAAQPQHARRHAVIRTHAADDLVATGFADALVVCARDFERGLVRFGAAAHREHARQAAGRNLRELGGELRHRDGGRALREVVQVDHLLVGGFANLGASVARVDGVVAAVDINP